MNISVNGQSQVPPGFRFHPTEEELLEYYLRKKISNIKIDLDVIRDVDLNKLEPWDIQAPFVLSLHPGQLQLAFPIRSVPFQLAPQNASVLARSSSRSSLFQLASRPARGALGGPVLQSSKPKDDEPHIILKILTRRIYQRKPFVDPISDAPTLAETIRGASWSFGTLIPKNPKLFLLAFRLANSDQAQLQTFPVRDQRPQPQLSLRPAQTKSPTRRNRPGEETSSR
ncbi:hypothetical protein F2Q69_00049715 [Brassica cretica]|uniref:NAC domain-containing protein n=1 Tax=Brassica cretica TaxID=69181 RepID=A0A8S9Q050_BRACR|nr:hypothetical protein F2Q69_00049715 [Brassica cretica]